MSDLYLGIQPQDWVRTVRTIADDDPVALYIKYIGSEENGTATVAATTNNITLAHGDTGSEAADSGVGANGVLDLTTYDTLYKLISAINAGSNWEAWGKDLLAGTDTNISEDNGFILAAGIAEQTVKTAAGVAFTVDTSLVTNEYLGCGVTLNGPSSELHPNDHQTLHEILRIKGDITWGTSATGLAIYEVDDDSGTDTLLATLSITSGTAFDFDGGGEPIVSTKGKRLVVYPYGTGAITAGGQVEVFSRSYTYGPGYRTSRLWSSVVQG